jgi:hypothetical protein
LACLIRTKSTSSQSIYGVEIIAFIKPEKKSFVPLKFVASSVAALYQPAQLGVGPQLRIARAVEQILKKPRQGQGRQVYVLDLEAIMRQRPA